MTRSGEGFRPHSRISCNRSGCDDSAELAFQTFMPQEWTGCDAGDASAKRPAQEIFLDWFRRGRPVCPSASGYCLATGSCLSHELGKL